MAAHFFECCGAEIQKTNKNPNTNPNRFDKEKSIMPVKNPKELFVSILRQVRQGTERSAAIYKELGGLAHNPEIQEALEARAFVSEQTLAKLDEAFKIIGEKPTDLTGRLHDVFVEDFRKELGEIQSPEARRLFVLAKANHLSHMRTAEYVTLVAASDLSGHHGVGVLLESCLADHLAFVERTKRLIRHVVEAKLAARAAG
jgi:ferritin-like metal-binding protein YciE